MTFRVHSYTEGHLGRVTAPNEAAAIAFLKEMGYEAGTYNLEQVEE